MQTSIGVLIIERIQNINMLERIQRRAGYKVDSERLPIIIQVLSGNFTSVTINVRL